MTADPAAPPPGSRLPDVGTSIFATMTALATRHGAINLAQGFPDFPVPEALREGVVRALREGHNQYAPMPGVPALREAIARMIRAVQDVSVDPDHEITITAGATQGIFTAVSALVRPGDEVIILDPSYDSYAPAVRLAGGTPRRIPLTLGLESNPGFDAPGLDAPTLDAPVLDAPVLDARTLEALDQALSPRTRLLILNTPGNPSGRVMTGADLDAIADRLAGSGTFVLSDEVYEHLVFDGAVHRSLLQHPRLRPRTLVLSSFGKIFHATGWKVGYVVAPPELTTEFRKAHQFTVFSVNTPVQVALAGHLAEGAPWTERLSFLAEQRTRFRARLEAGSRFRILPCEGSYFQVADYSRIRDVPDLDFAAWLTEAHGVASIPLSPFYENPPVGQRLVRFCFAKAPETLDAALERLCRI
jgi:methionine transaminase